MKIRATIIAFTLGLLVIGIPSTSAAATKLSLSVRQTPSATEALLRSTARLNPPNQVSLSISK